MKDKKELIKQQLRAFSGWLKCSIVEFDMKAQIAADAFDDQAESEKNEAIRQAFVEAKTLFDMVKENIEDLINGGDDGEHDGIDPYYM